MVSQNQQLQFEQLEGIVDRISIGFRIVIGQDQFDWCITMEEDDDNSLSTRLSMLQVLITDESSYTCIICNSENKVAIM